MDADWVLARNFDSLFNPRIAPTLGMNLDLVDALDERQRQLGYRSGRSLLTWGLRRGPFPGLRGMAAAPRRCSAVGRLLVRPGGIRALPDGLQLPALDDD
jgi:hypothetical protein